MSSNPVFLPKTLTVLRGYTRRMFARDLIAGITVGFVALPLALALGIGSIPDRVAAESGVSPPVAGIVTAIVAGFLISALGGTRAGIGGPTAAFIVIVASIASRHGFGGLAIATIMAGIILVIMGLARLGGLIKYIPYPVTLGFTAGIGITIFTGQIKDLLHLEKFAGETAEFPAHFVGKVSWYFEHASTVHWPTAMLSLACVAFLFLWPKLVTRRIPSPIVVLVVATAAAHLIERLSGGSVGFLTIGEKFGSLPTSLPMPRLPSVEWSQLPELVGPAFTIAMLAAIESLLSAVVADGMLGTRHRSNTELIAQGAANIASPFFGGIPATGAIARTATNIQSGGRTPVAGMVHALVLLAILLVIGRYAEMVPLCVLAAVLVVVAWNMSEVHRVVWLVKGPRHDAAVLLTTLLLTVFTDLTIAVGVGMVLAAFLFMKRMADLTNVDAVTGEMRDPGNDSPLSPAHTARKRELPAGVEVYDINGPFFFGAAYKLRETLDTLGKPPKVLILNMGAVNAIDATGLYALDELRRRCAKDRTRLILSGTHAQPIFKLSNEGLLDEFGADNLAGTIEEALEMVHEQHDLHGTVSLPGRHSITENRGTP